MRFWKPLDLTAAHRPLLFVDETEVIVQNLIGIYEGKEKVPNYQDGRIYLTSHRLCYVDNELPLTNSVTINLQDLKTIQYSAGFLKSSPKITFYFKPADSVNASAPALDASPSPPPLPSSPSLSLSLSTWNNPNDSSVSLPNIKSPSSVHAVPSTSGMMSLITWICPICSFSNSLPGNYRPGISPPPPCSTCGVKPSQFVIDNAMAAYDTNNSESDGSVQDQEEANVCPKCTFVNHSSMRNCEICGARLSISTFNPSDYVLDKNTVRQDSYLPFSIKNSEQSILRHGFYAQEVPTYVKISFRGGGDKTFFEKVKAVVLEKTWLKNQARHGNLAQTIFGAAPASEHDYARPVPERQKTAPRFGIHGLQRLGEKERQKNHNLISSLDDLQSLMKKAKDLVALAESFASRLASAPGVPDEARQVLRDSSKALGLSSPIVTKEMAGDGNERIYYAELARQLAEFLTSGVLKQEGGVVTLFDLFALYNRARGIALISPADLENACAMFEKLHLPFKLRQFKSGLTVVQESSRTDEAMIQALVKWIDDVAVHPGRIMPGVTAEEVSQHFRWSVGVCVEELETAQEQGKLCCDVVVEGTRYFVNEITEYRWNWKKEIFHEKILGQDDDNHVAASVVSMHLK
ncbi:EAP30/Vps36 family-domain-containing protein [Lipomyces japonicus]|uniref:EAP30/Vps36 family-domain-containing protein n=1 Tax=Lipomyces japonicus TaxID=56871 RepID=UPI0034CE1B2D